MNPPIGASRSSGFLAWGLRNLALFAAVEIVTMFAALIVHREEEDTFSGLVVAAVAYASWTWMLLLAGAIPYLALVRFVARRRRIDRLISVALSPILALPLLLTFFVGFGYRVIPWVLGGTLVAGALLRPPPQSTDASSRRRAGDRAPSRRPPADARPR